MILNSDGEALVLVSRESGVVLQCHYFQIYSNLEWLYLLEGKIICLKIIRMPLDLEQKKTFKKQDKKCKYERTMNAIP